MLNRQFTILFQEWHEGRKYPSYLSAKTGVNERIFRLPIDQVSEATQARVSVAYQQYIRKQLMATDFSLEEIDSWLEASPANGLDYPGYSSLVYGFQLPGQPNYPETLEFAYRFDVLCDNLAKIYQKRDLPRFKQTLLKSEYSDQLYFSTESERFDEGGSQLLKQFISATNWDEVYKPLDQLGFNFLMSLLARWDVEFGTQVFFFGMIPRSLFALVLPKLDPTAGSIEQPLAKRRDMFWYPVRRLIDFISCLGHYHCSNEKLLHVPPVKNIALLTGVSETTLVNWRDGTKKFTFSSFDLLWSHLATNHRPPRNIPAAPWPMYIATLFWQNLLTRISTTSSERTVHFLDQEYLRWWQLHFENLKTKGSVFGTRPWPAFIDEL